MGTSNFVRYTFLHYAKNLNNFYNYKLILKLENIE